MSLSNTDEVDILKFITVSYMKGGGSKKPKKILNGKESTKN